LLSDYMSIWVWDVVDHNYIILVWYLLVYHIYLKKKYILLLDNQLRLYKKCVGMAGQFEQISIITCVWY